DVLLTFLPAAELGDRVEGQDGVFGMPPAPKGEAAVASLPGAREVAWSYPGQEPVWAAPLAESPAAADFIDFAGGPVGHRLWSESKAGFTIVSHSTSEAHEWVAEHRVKATYRMTAMRMLAECGGIRSGLCIDIGCGPGHLEVELAKLSDLTIIGLDIDPGAKPLFEKRIRAAGLHDRVSFVLGDAQELPFPDNHADVIVSRGTLTFIPDIAKCLREVRRVLKPTGVAFLGGRYLYTPHKDKITTEKLKDIVQAAGVPGAQVVERNGQWVKIIGPGAPKAAANFQGGSHMFAGRLLMEYPVDKGRCLVFGRSGDLERELARLTDLEVVALYADEKNLGAARDMVREAVLQDRVACRAGAIGRIPFGDGSFDLVAGAGPFLLFQKDRTAAMREVHRVLRPGGVARIGGRFNGMPRSARVPSDTLRREAEATGIPSIRVIDDEGQWVEIRKWKRVGRSRK
ncbi:MAG: class I SAM-dependent methyltransferase, partial [Planctomycetota bacterium]